MATKIQHHHERVSDIETVSLALASLTMSLTDLDASATCFAGAMLLWMLKTALVDELGEERFEEVMNRLAGSCDQQLKVTRPDWSLRN